MEKFDGLENGKVTVDFRIDNSSIMSMGELNNDHFRIIDLPINFPSQSKESWIFWRLAGNIECILKWFFTEC